MRRRKKKQMHTERPVTPAVQQIQFMRKIHEAWDYGKRSR